MLLMGLLVWLKLKLSTLGRLATCRCLHQFANEQEFLLGRWSLLKRAME